MSVQIDYERLIMSGVLVAALILWGGIVAEFTGLHPNGEDVAATVTGVFVAGFTVVVVTLSYVTGKVGRDRTAK